MLITIVVQKIKQPLLSSPTPQQAFPLPGFVVVFLFFLIELLDLGGDFNGFNDDLSSTSSSYPDYSTVSNCLKVIGFLLLVIL